jgi:phospholipid-binding lipoprotein MlaA
VRKIVQCLFLILSLQWIWVPAPDARVHLSFSDHQLGPPSNLFLHYFREPQDFEFLDLSPGRFPLSAQVGSDPEAPVSSDLPFSQEDQDGFFDEDFGAEFEKEFEIGANSGAFDPLSGYNRFMTQVNDTFYFYLLKPIARGYRFVFPEMFRISISRFFNNLLFPMHFVNNILQLKFKQAGVELVRFGVNSTVGVGGFWDPADHWFDLNPYPEDFGQTLGFYGIGGGFHLVLPILGPSNLRDFIGLIGDFYLDPVCYIGTCYAGYWEVVLGIRSYKTINYSSLHIGEYESIKKDALDLYIFIRDAYEQKREKEIKE